MTTISKEERMFLRAWRESRTVPLPSEDLMRLLDALEAAEARAEKAERQRDKLTTALAALEIFPAEVYPQQLDYANNAIVDIWLEWAAQKEEYNV